jgi:hypothetical protein
MLYP